MITYDGDLAVVDGYKFRKDKKTGYYLSSKRIDGKRRRLHVYMWEKENGTVPKGHQIHHIDHDKDNNEIGNLQMMTYGEHMSYHANNMSEEYRLKRRERILSINDLAKAWHKSEEGREWHRQHARMIAESRKPIDYVCTQCGAGFSSKRVFSEDSNRFCSNNCKSAYRRKMGFDNVTRTCKECENEFTTNKYSPRKYCESCQGRKRGHRAGLQYVCEG